MAVIPGMAPVCDKAPVSTEQVESFTDFVLEHWVEGRLSVIGRLAATDARMRKEYLK